MRFLSYQVKGTYRSTSLFIHFCVNVFTAGINLQLFNLSSLCNIHHPQLQGTWSISFFSNFFSIHFIRALNTVNSLLKHQPLQKNLRFNILLEYQPNRTDFHFHHRVRFPRIQSTFIQVNIIVNI